MKKQSYSYSEAYDASLLYFKGDELAARVWVNKYALKDSLGNIYEKSPEDMHWRIANEIARVEAKYKNSVSAQELFELLDRFKYIVPQGSPMTGIGNDYQVASLSNCFVIGVDGAADSYGAIIKVDEEQVQLMKRRGGVGHDLSHIRPQGSPVKNSALTSTGLAPFMERYSNSTREVAQDGRRGALMLSVSIKHPDSESFIDAKMTDGKVTGANVSVKLDDAFMRAATEGKPYVQQYPIDSANPTTTKEIDASALWKKIVHNAWRSAEPGVLFWDTIIRESVPDCYADLGYKTVSTNPCLTEETLVYVADGRGYVKIGDLAKEGVDVPVFCYDNNRKIVVRTMRHPRLTGYNQKILKITLDSGDVIRCTENHKFLTTDGRYVQAKDMTSGTSLDVVTRDLQSVIANDDRDIDISKKYYHLSNTANRMSEHRLIAGHYLGQDKIDGKVVHHIDRNSHNNTPSNLMAMYAEEHNREHAKDMLGDKNPIHKLLSDPERYKEYSETMSEAVSGDKNGRYASQVSTDKVFARLCDRSRELGRPLVKSEIIAVANSFGLSTISDYRMMEITKTGTKFSDLVDAISEHTGIKWCADFEGMDSRLKKAAHQAISEGYKIKFEYNKARKSNELLVNRTCEYCGEEFFTSYNLREVAFCSSACSIKKYNKSDDHKDAVNNAYAKKAVETDRKKELLFTELKFNLGRNPLEKEFIDECKKQGIPSRLKTKHGKYKRWKEFVEASESFNHRVVSIEYDGVEDVYNGTVDEFHNFFIGGFSSKDKENTHKSLSINTLNCGEIPLCPYDSCRLLAINLYSYVVNPFKKEAYFDYELFKKHVELAQRIMDDIIDLELEKIERIIDKINADPEKDDVKHAERELWNKIYKKTGQGRRTGVGITAEGDMLAALGLRYGTEEATEFSEEIHKTVALHAYRSSVIMAKERGAFEVYDSEREMNNPFISRLREADHQLYEDMKKHGRRNIACLTIAPTGTTSLMTQTTSGIEPVFLPVYKRRRKVNANDTNVRVDFVDDTGDSFEEYIVFHHKFATWMGANGYDPSQRYTSEEVDAMVAESPYYKATSNDVDWLMKVKMQGRIQKWVDHSISVTINLPNDASEDLVDRLYVEAWKSGCKGCTVYRDGSRSGVLLSTKDDKKNDTPQCKPPTVVEVRPKVLEADVVRFQNNKEKWVAFIGLLDGNPYEIFTGLQDDEDGISLPKTVTTGRIIKNVDTNGCKRYDFQFENKRGHKITIEGLSERFNKEYLNYAKLISGVLRWRMPIEQVVKLVGSLQLDSEHINTWKNGVERALKRYIQDGTEAVGKKCPECGNEALIYQEGCLICTSCGTSRCG